jgi:hypothetical protein
MMIWQYFKRILKNLGYGAPPRHETRAFSESRNERELAFNIHSPGTVPFLSLQILWAHSITILLTYPIPNPRIGFHWQIHRPLIRANNFKFSTSILPFLPCYLPLKFNLEDKAWFCKLSVQFFASRDCINPFSTGILQYTGFTFEVPEYCPYTYRRSRACPSKIDSCVPRLRNFLLPGTLPYTRFTFEVPEHQSYIYNIVFYSTVPVTALKIRRSYLSRLRATTL